MNGPVVRGLDGVNQIRDDFLARAAFAGDENGNIAGRDALDGAHDGLHGVALENGAAPSETASRKRADFQRALDEVQQAFGIERLFLEMKRAALGGFDGDVEGRMAGQHDDFGLGPFLLDDAAAGPGRWRRAV